MVWMRYRVAVVTLFVSCALLLAGPCPVAAEPPGVIAGTTAAVSVDVIKARRDKAVEALKQLPDQCQAQADKRSTS